MRDSDNNVSIWTTITSYVNEPPFDDGGDPISLRQAVAEYLVGEPLLQVGTVEGGYSFTGIIGDEPFPDAFSLLEDGNELSLVLLIGRLGERSLPTVPTTLIETAVHSLISSIESICQSGESIPEAGTEGVGEFTYIIQNEISKVQLLSVTVVVLGVALPTALDARRDRIPPIKISNRLTVQVQVETVDIPTLQEQWDKSSNTGTVDLELSEFLGAPLPCLRSTERRDQFETLLTVIPGDALANIYYRYKSRVLQKNLRNFLQATGKVNKGIQKTLKTQPERFLAYNNGLTITASSAVFDERGRIVVLRDFQIVNGGQTTASLDYAKRFNGVDLSSVAVQAKITVIDTASDPSFIDDVSNYANSQNKVKLSDFQARDGFQTALSRLMRDNPRLMWTWESGESNYWYYEAFRGGYLTAKYQRTGRQREQFERIFPKNQVIDKLELAKVENGWDGYPHFVCRGADKNFTEWVKRTRPQSRPEPDMQYCIQLVAKVLLFRAIATRVKDAGYQGFKSQIVSYSYSYLCFLLERRASEVDLDQIWSLGHVPSELGAVLDELIAFVADFLPNNAGREDPAQWAKKETAWMSLKRTLETGRAPRIYPALTAVDLVRPTTFDLGVACARAVEALTKTRVPLNKSQLLEAMWVHDSYWSDVRSVLLNNYGVIQVGGRGGATYTLSDL
jgi:hypothetical protein